MLRTENYTQGTLRCHGRTDKLCVGEILWGIFGGPVTPTQNQTLYKLALDLRLLYLCSLSSSEFDEVVQ